MTSEIEEPPTIDADRINKLSRLVLKMIMAGGVLIWLFTLALVGVLFQAQQNDNREIRYLLHQQAQINTRIFRDIYFAGQGSCAFFGDVGTLPLIASGPQRTGIIGVRIVLDARSSYYARHCIEPLASPSPELIELARLYGLKIPNR